MKLSEIKTTAAAYLHRKDYELTVNGVDLALIALNQVREEAEQTNDFNFTRKLLHVSVDGVTGGSLDPSVKTVVDVGTFDRDGNFMPAEWTTTADALNQRRDTSMYETPRYPSDGDVQLVTMQGFVFSGQSVYFMPKTPNLVLDVGVEAYTFTPDWVAADVDPLNPTPYNGPWTQRGHKYLLWSIIVHLNQLWRDFVFRQEGNLPPPEKLAEQGLATLITWDTFQYEQFRRHHR
jgi:hypothetical protein